MNIDINHNSTDAPDLGADVCTEVIPPLPGGGSWRWAGGQWVSNEPVIEIPAEPAPTTEE